MFSFCLERLRQERPADYAACLFLPEANRGQIASLLAFDLEISRIPALVREAPAGEIRLTWWQEALNGERSGEAKANPVSHALLAVIDEHDLPIERFVRYLEARIFDLYNDPMPDRETLEAYFGETESFIFHTMAKISGAVDDSRLADAAGHSGVAQGVKRTIQRLPYDLQRQRLFIPMDLIAAAGLSADRLVSGGEGPEFGALSAGMVAIGNEHEKEARKAIRLLPKSIQAAFLRFSVVRPALQVYARQGETVFTAPAKLSPLREQLALWKAAIFGF